MIATALAVVPMRRPATQYSSLEVRTLLEARTPMPMQAARYASTRIRSTSMGSRYLPRRRPLKIHKVRIGETTINAAISQPESAMPRTSKPRQIGRNETAENTIRNTSADRSPPAIRKK
jgi:hypothetical protein